MPEISVIVPVFDVELYLCVCLDSILSQSFTDFELILVDDGSPDRCGDICDLYAEKDPRISVIHKENGGLSDARNAGVCAARCDWTCFVDSDDLIHPDMLRLLFQATKEPGVEMVICDCVQDKEPPQDFFCVKDPSYTVSAVTEDLLLKLYSEKKRAYWRVVPVLVRTEIVKNNPFTVGRIFEDNAVSVYWLHYAEKVAFLSAALYFYRINPAGIVNAAFSERRFDFLWALEQQMHLYERVGYQRLLGETTKNYIATALWLADRAKTELNDAELERRTIKKAVLMQKKYRSVLTLSEHESRKLFKAAHPILHKMRKKINSLRK